MTILKFDVISMARAIPMTLALGFMMTLAACTTHRPGARSAPVEQRTVSGRSTPAHMASSAAVPASGEVGHVPPGAENAGKPGFHTVKPGDTLIRVGLETGQHWKDLMAWNNLENANALEVGQVLRVVPPGADPHAVATRTVVSPKVEARPLESAPKEGVPKAPVVPASTPPTPPPVQAASVPASAPKAVVPVAPPPPPSAPAAVIPPSAPEDELNWQWPAAGSVLGGFEESRSKGLSIGGKAGDPVLAAAGGKVAYAGSGLRGYGNLVIIKHNNTYLSAYAHNQKLLVKEDQEVRRGQKIAEMGSTDADKTHLHFEIRKLGRPVDPAKFLPAR